MYNFKEVTDEKVWNSKVTESSDSTFLLSWEWAEFQRIVGNKFLSIGVYESEELVGLLPITIISARRGKYLQMRHGPLLDWENEAMVNESLAFIKDLAKEHGSWFARFSPRLTLNNENNRLLESYGLKAAKSHEIDAEHTLLIDLSKEVEVLDSELRRDTKANIRKALKNDATIEIYDDMSKFDVFWEIFDESVKRNKWTAHSKEYLHKECEFFMKCGMTKIFLAKYEDEYTSASMFTYFNKRSVYHHSGSTTKHRNIPSSHLLQWEAILHAKEIGMLKHDLWGVVNMDQTSHPWYGLSMFKRGFGGYDETMVHAHDLIIKPQANATRLFEQIESKRAGY